MNNYTVKIKKNDTARKYTDYLTIGSNAVDISGSTVTLRWDDFLIGAAIDERSSGVTIEDAENGVVSYTFDSGDFGSDVVRVDWKVVFPTATELRFPTTGYVYLLMVD